VADQLTSTGLTIDDLETRLNTVIAELRANIHTNIELTAEDPMGQLMRTAIEKLQALAELLQALYSAWDPNGATDQSLTALALITGTERRAATYGSVTLNVTLNAGVTLPAGSIAGVGTSETNRWSTNVAVTNSGGAPAVLPVAASCITAGAVNAALNTIQTIVTAVAGWTAVDNPADAVPGLPAETDGELRLRRAIEVALGGSTSVDAIQSELSAMDDIISVTVYENDLSVWAGGLPANSFEAIIWDDGAAVGAEVAEVIFESKPAGIRAYGTTTVAHVDDQGNSHDIGYTLADDQQLDLEYTITQGPDWPGVADFRTYINAQSDSLLGVGDDVIYERMKALAFDNDGWVDDVTLFRMQLDGAGWVVVNIVVAPDEIAVADTGTITVL
jgi:uncharacterized phage protein gp47/JayE